MLRFYADTFTKVLGENVAFAEILRTQTIKEGEQIIPVEMFPLIADHINSLTKQCQSIGLRIPTMRLQALLLKIQDNCLYSEYFREIVRYLSADY